MKIHQSFAPVPGIPGDHHYYETYVPNRWFRENGFVSRAASAPGPLPDFARDRERLPQPSWEGHEAEIACYWRAWELAFRNIRHPMPGSGFVSDFADTAFNDSLFMWDSAFITMFWRYGIQVWDGIMTLDNFYARQHPDGYICRQIRMPNGTEPFQRHDPSATGPNILPWAEWEHYLVAGDRERLVAVFPALAAYARWMRRNRTWPDGSYWATGWSCGMDNQPRMPHAVQPDDWADGLGPEANHVWYDHAHMTWADATLQAVLADRILVAMAEALGRADEATEFRSEADRLGAWINDHLWDARTAFLHDCLADGSLVRQVKSIGAYWALLADILPPARRAAMIAHLDDPAQFCRVHRVPSLSADTPQFDPDGGYWLGAVWAPTNYMVLRGLTLAGEDRLAHEIGLNHVVNVAACCAATGTLFENYAPDKAGEGRHGRDFVGWTGLPPIAVLLEYVFGLRADVPQGRLVWDVRLAEAHGVERYPFGKQGLVDLHCAARASADEPPRCEIRSSVPLAVELRWPGGVQTVSAG